MGFKHFLFLSLLLFPLAFFTIEVGEKVQRCFPRLLVFETIVNFVIDSLILFTHLDNLDLQFVHLTFDLLQRFY